MHVRAAPKPPPHPAFPPRRTVRISNPSFSNSPCTRGAPHSGLAVAMVLTKLSYGSPNLLAGGLVRIKNHAFWFSFVGSDPTRIQFLDSTGPRIIPTYLNRVLCAPGLVPLPRWNREGKSSNHSAVGATSPT